MVQCRIACCTSSFRKKCKDGKMTFFTLLKKRKSLLHSVKRDEYRNSQINIKSKQHDAWIDIINSGYGNGKNDQH